MRQQRRRSPCDLVEAIPHVHSHNEIGNAGFVFKRDERNSLGGSRPLANKHDAGAADTFNPC